LRRHDTFTVNLSKLYYQEAHGSWLNGAEMVCKMREKSRE